VVRPVSLKVGIGDFAFAAGDRLNAIGLLTGRSSSDARRLRLVDAKSRSSPAGRRCCEISDPRSRHGTGRSIGAADLLRHDALGAKPAGVCKNGRAVLGHVFAVSRVVGQFSLAAFHKPSAPT
jgi:hypothetical protein